MPIMNRLSSMARQAAVAMLLLASCAAIPQTAANRYTVEIVVFRTASQAAALPGSAPAAPAAVTVPDDGVEMTAVTTRRLTGAASKLRSTAGYRVLAHTAWAQSPTSCGGRACRESLRGVSAAQLGLTRAGISGKVGLQRGESLHLGIDLTIDDGGRRYRIQEVRPLRKIDQAQYFDHPAVGVVAIITAGG
jgi:hypothetical protein